MILNKLPVCLPQDGDPAAVEHTMHPMAIGTAVKDLTTGVSYPRALNALLVAANTVLFGFWARR
jgi:hypothetical protein